MIKRNVVSIIQKTVQNDNVNMWSTLLKKSSSIHTSDRNHNATKKNKLSKIKKKRCSSKFFDPSRSTHCFFLEYLINLPDRSSNITIFPLKDCTKVKNMFPTFDSNILQLIELFELVVNQVGENPNFLYAISTTIVSSPNRDQYFASVHKLSLKRI